MADEAAFMSQLLQGLDDSFWSAVPSPDPSPVKQRKPLPPATPCTPTKSRQPAQTRQILSSTIFSANDHDITAFLEGSDNWDLDADPFSPIKPTSLSKVVTADVNRFALIFERV
jgi:DNA replication ATP-dependent helicase Dna2